MYPVGTLLDDMSHSAYPPAASIATDTKTTRCMVLILLITQSISNTNTLLSQTAYAWLTLVNKSPANTTQSCET